MAVGDIMAACYRHMFVLRTTRSEHVKCRTAVTLLAKSWAATLSTVSCLHSRLQLSHALAMYASTACSDPCFPPSRSRWSNPAIFCFRLPPAAPNASRLWSLNS